MKNKKISISKKQCFLCCNFTLEKIDTKQINPCTKSGLDAEKCPNWSPVNVSIKKKYMGFKRIIVISE